MLEALLSLKWAGAKMMLTSVAKEATRVLAGGRC
jgi:hypothetical protein